MIEIEASVSAKTGAKVPIGGDGRVLAMNDQVLGTGMPCDGSMRVYVEQVLPRPALSILGHGRVAERPCAIGATMDFAGVVDDLLVDRAALSRSVPVAGGGHGLW